MTREPNRPRQIPRAARMERLRDRTTYNTSALGEAIGTLSPEWTPVWQWWRDPKFLPSSLCRTAGKMLRKFPAALLFPALVMACSPDSPPPPWHDEGTYRWRELQVRGG